MHPNLPLVLTPILGVKLPHRFKYDELSKSSTGLGLRIFMIIFLRAFKPYISRVFKPYFLMGFNPYFRVQIPYCFRAFKPYC